MASTNKNLIQSLRSAHDPHFKLEGRVDGLEKNIPIQIAELHKTLSKSFGMQRKTLARVLGLESRLSNLEVAIEVWTSREASRRQQEAEDEEIPEQLDNVINDIRGEKEVGGEDTTPPTNIATKPKPKRKRLRIKKKKISGADLKKNGSQESIEKIESRVVTNEKKITLVKNIIKAQKSDLAEKLRSLESEPESQQQMGSPLLASLQSIAASVDSIRDTLIQKQDFDEDIREDMRIAGEKADADKQEKELENTKPKPLTKLGEKIIAPVTSIFGKIFNFIKTLILGKFLMNFIDWFANPANQGKIKSFVRFIGDWWPALTAAVLLFGTGFTGLVAGLVKVIVFGVTKLLGLIPLLKAALAKLKVGGLLSKIPGGKWVKGGLLLGGTAATAWGVNKVMTNDEGTEEFGEGVQEFNKGGQVPGSGNKDTVPAMLTPGEFVMSKGAVQKYGVNTLEGMNAAAGGTNIPTVRGGYNEGGKVADRSHFGTEGYRMGQMLPPQFYYGKETLTVSYIEKGGKVLEDKTELTELTGAIGMPDLIEHQTQLVDSLRKVKGYEDINFMDVVQYPDGRGRLVGMPEETLFPILNSSDAWKASDAKRDEAIRIDQEAGTTNLNPVETAKAVGMNGGGLVQGFQGGGLVTVKPGTINSYQDAIDAGIKVEDIVTGSGRFGSIRWKEKMPRGLFGLGKQKYQVKGTKWNLSGVGGAIDKELAMSTRDYVNMKMGWSGASSAKVESVKPKDSLKSSKSSGRVRGKSKMYNIKSKEPKNTVVAYEQEANKNQQKSAPARGGNEIPSFDVAPIRDPHKMTTLQIVLF